MHVISKRTLREYWERHANAQGPLSSWHAHAREASWSRPSDVKRDHADASILSDERVVFNIKGNDYRLVVRINYKSGTVFIRWVGSHAEYDRIDPLEV